MCVFVMLKIDSSCINDIKLFLNDKLFVLVFVLLYSKFSMFFYDVMVELMDIHEIKCKISNQAISGTSHDSFVRFFLHSVSFINIYFSL